MIKSYRIAYITFLLLLIFSGVAMIVLQKVGGVPWVMVGPIIISIFSSLDIYFRMKGK